MASNKQSFASSLLRPRAAVSAAFVVVAFAVAGCSVSGPRESPLNEVTAGSPTVSEVFHGADSARSSNEKSKDRFNEGGRAQPVASVDARQSPYWEPLSPMRSRFARVPNPDLVMVVYPHLAKGKYPVPGYVTVFPMYDQIEYALPGEVEQEQFQARQRYVGSRQAVPDAEAKR